jgi:hypothetical protein
MIKRDKNKLYLFSFMCEATQLVVPLYSYKDGLILFQKKIENPFKIRQNTT